MTTPMELQYEQIKKKYPDCILFFRLGDFYEGFDEDAKIMAKTLGIVLTSRRKGEKKRPMAGIPYHALSQYLHKMIKAGYKVAIAEQTEDPELAKGIVDRDVVRIITPGTVIDDKSLGEIINNYIICINKYTEKKTEYWGLAVCDVSTGEFWINEFYSKQNAINLKLIQEINRISPAEILISNKIKLPELNKFRIEKIEDYEFDYDVNQRRLIEHFKTSSLKGFGIDKYKSAICSAGVLLKYIQDTQKSDLSHISRIIYKNLNNFMALDENTIRNLELVSSIHQNGSASLYNTLNQCKTPMGKRKLFEWIIRPLISKILINDRLYAVEELSIDNINLRRIIEILDDIFDIERVLGKIGTNQSNARDLLMLKNSLYKAKEISLKLRNYNTVLMKKIYKNLTFDREIKDLVELLEKSIALDPPPTIMEGGIIKDNYNKEIAELKQLSTRGKDWIRTLQQKEIEHTKIPSLKVRYNKVFGYYIEISKPNLSKVPANYIRKQTLVNAERFITPELKEMEEKVLTAEEKLIQLEYKIFLEIRNKVASKSNKIQTIINGISTLDCLANFADLSRLNSYIKPQIANTKDGFIKIKNGRHPVVEQISKEPFVPNDTYLDNEKFQVEIITGPNMAGKSTFIRQVALIVLMAQIGCFVPAESMEFGIVDRIFTRVGASDNIARGESTFMVEMTEVSNILNNATERSLLIVDEVGRGTSTYDGVAIAWAVAEYIHNYIKAKTLFATHYHELIQLEDKLEKVKNFNIAVKENEGKIIFLRKIKQGGTDKSYGIHVAQLAGIPDKVIKRSNEILGTLQQENMGTVQHVETELVKEETKTKQTSQIPLLTKLPEDPVLRELKKIDINKMTPIEALQKLDELTRKCRV